MYNFEELLIALLRSTIKGDVEEIFSILPISEENWKMFISIAARHGVIGLVYEQLEKTFSMSSHVVTQKKTSKDIKPSLPLLVIMHQEHAKRRIFYNRQQNVLSSFAATLSEKGVETKVLKGMAFSRYYDTPSLRECGDCDCYLYSTNDCNAFEIGNEIAVGLGGITEDGGYKHSHIYLKGVTIENHRYITNFDGTKRGIKFEKFLTYVLNNEKGDYIGDTKLISPSAHFNFLMLAKHSLANFLNSGLTLRMVYDWAMFMQAEQHNLEWNSISIELKEHHLYNFAEVMTSLCTDFLGIGITNGNIPHCTDKQLIHDILIDTLRNDKKRLSPNETFVNKVWRILIRYKRIWKYRALASEKYTTIVWNSFAFSSYVNRRIHLPNH